MTEVLIALSHPQTNDKHTHTHHRGRERSIRSREQRSTLLEHCQKYQTLNPNPKPQTLNPKPQTQNQKPQTLNPKPLNPKPQTLKP